MIVQPTKRGWRPASRSIPSTGNGDAAVMRRVRFDTAVEEDESVPGVLSKAARAHVLPRLSEILGGAGLPGNRAGSVQIMPPDELLRLAKALRCDADALMANAGERLVSRSAGNAHQRVRFGDLVLPRSNLDLEHRWIAPTTLTQTSHHRVAWLNRLLPYCPISLERLVNTCGLCSSRLEWKLSWGVAVCESCEGLVPPSAEDPLPPELADDYRLFADLVSPLAGRREAARASLSARLSGTSFPTLVRLACRLGMICRDEPITNVRQHAMGMLAAETLASVVVTGVRMLKDWPKSFKEFAYGRADKLRTDRGVFLKWRVILRRLTVARTEGGEQAALVLEAMPDLSGPIERSFSQGRPHYLINEAQRVIGINHERLSRGIDAGVFDQVEVPGLSRRHIQLDKERIDAVARLIRGTPSILSLPGRFELPLYAVEQLIGPDMLVWEKDPAILTLREWPCVQEASIKSVLARLGGKARETDVPKDAIPIVAAARRIGGREKPWGKILGAVIDGSLPAWRAGAVRGCRSILVRPDEMAAFDQIIPDARKDGFPCDPLITKDDAGELLNTHAKYLPDICGEFDIAFEEVGRADRTDKDVVLSAARLMASSAEIGFHLRIHSRAVGARMASMGIVQRGLGWDRAMLVEKGLLPKPPA